ncbi:MAG TPA: Abi family protein [Corynebacterium sp.]|nr:Abi family protein [Corynebacterium sp.]
MSRIYTKPHLTFESQLNQLEERGLAVGDRQRGLEALKRVGYYRLSAYWYPFREIKPEAKRSTKWNYRFDHFVRGRSLEESIEIYEFDSKLRSYVFEALEVIEVSLRAAIAYVAGRESKFIHLERCLLDEKRCSHVPKGKSEDSYSIWLKGYRRQLNRASGEDFVRHHKARYGDRLPIWIATEFLDFGSISMLFNYLPRGIKNDISPSFGVLQGEVLSSWVRNLNYVRNIVAHHSRLWNKYIVTRMQPPNRAMVDPGLYHLADPSGQDRFTKVYPSLAVIAYILSFIDPENDWRLRVADLVRNFPETEGVTPVNLMGFPHEWQSLEMWRNDLLFVNGVAISRGLS